MRGRERERRPPDTNAERETTSCTSNGSNSTFYSRRMQYIHRTVYLSRGRRSSTGRGSRVTVILYDTFRPRFSSRAPSNSSVCFFPPRVNLPSLSDRRAIFGTQLSRRDDSRIGVIDHRRGALIGASEFTQRTTTMLYICVRAQTLR